MTPCLPSRLSRVRIPRTGSLHSPLEAEAGQECLGRAPGGFPGGSHLLAAFRPGPSLPPLAGKRTAGSCRLPTKRRVHASRDAGTWGVPGDGNPPRFCLECGCRACANPTSDPVCRLLPSLVQVLLVVGPPSWARLVVCRGDQQRTVDHRPPFPAPADSAQGRGKERLMGLWGPHASASSLAARTASGLCRRNRTCPVTLLAVHAASAHEA